MVHAKHTLAIAAAAAASSVKAQATGTTGAIVPLISQRYAWPYTGPNKLDSTNGPRGTQQGDNICNSVPGQFNQTSNCIISHVNSIADFCLWAPPQANSSIADTEGEEVAWCTKAGYGTRLIPDGALKGVQFVKTPDYVAVAGFIDQTLINIAAGDTGGELDPHGADNRGNPLGSLMYSNAFSAGNAQFQQVIEWHNFMGGNLFCIKACNPASANAASMCQHIYDRIGCAYNVPLNYAAINGTFQSCAGDDQVPPGLFVVNGVTSTYQQPAESLGAISTIPYTAAVPATSNCTPYTSSALYTDAFSAAARLASMSSAAAPSSSTAASARPTTTGAPAAAGASSAAAGASSSARTGAAGPVMASHFGMLTGVVAAIGAGLVGLAAVAL